MESTASTVLSALVNPLISYSCELRCHESLDIHMRAWSVGFHQVERRAPSRTMESTVLRTLVLTLDPKPQTLDS